MHNTWEYIGGNVWHNEMCGTRILAVTVTITSTRVGPMTSPRLQ